MYFIPDIPCVGVSPSKITKMNRKSYILQIHTIITDFPAKSYCHNQWDT